ncbi:hypothetical protein OHR01_000910 [Salmonella enterica]|nr:hypothetical protein [Salmonella enterica]EKG3678512.1 hypothetical protein [Salmonella enterica]
MSNQVKVIFTFEQVASERKEVRGGVNFMDCLSVSVISEGLTEDIKIGPHHIYAMVMKKNASEIISFLTGEVKAVAEKAGYEIYKTCANTTKNI